VLGYGGKYILLRSGVRVGKVAATTHILKIWRPEVLAFWREGACAGMSVFARPLLLGLCTVHILTGKEHLGRHC
jgi:hypothetical protein